jgi:uncharacterized protein (TIGR00369 family)
VVYPGLAALPGIEQVRALLTGRAPAPPLARLTGRRIIDASVGSATYALPATDWGGLATAPRTAARRAVVSADRPADRHPARERRSGSRGLRAFGEPLALRNEWGTVYGGVLTLVAKSAAAAAVQTTAAGGTAFTALDIKINFLRPVLSDGREIVATGTVLHPGKRLAIANADVMHGGVRVAALTGTTALTPPA